MNEVAEGLGAAIEGTLTARAVEPDAGEGAGPAAERSDCANCGTSISGSYCSNCGQKVHIHRTLTAIGHDLMHGVLHLDGKLSHTLPLLVFKPGKLTRRYIDGERAKFVSPMSMFLFSVFAMFAVFQILGISTPTDLGGTTSMDQVETSLVKAETDIQEKIAEVDAQLAALGPEDQGRAELEARKAQLTEELDQLSVMQDLPFLSTEDVEARIGPDGLRIGQPGDTAETSAASDDSGTGIDFIDKGLAKKWQDNPGLMLYKLQANAYKFSWLLIPLSIPFVWLTFAWRRRFKAYDHAVFVTYSLSFMSLLFITASLLSLSEAVIPIAGLLMVFVPPIHLYKHLRHTYALSRFSAFWRLMALSVFIWIVIGLFLQTLLLIGAF